MTRDQWNERYRASARLWSATPNQLVAAAGLEPLTVDRTEPVERAFDTPTGARVALDCLGRARRELEPS